MGKWIRRLSWALAAVVILGGSGLALALRHQSRCVAPPEAATGTAAFAAIVQPCYGGPEVLRLARLPLAPLAPGRVRVRVVAAAVNPLDWHFVRGEPRVMRLGSGIGAPSESRLGADFAGVVESVAPGVTGFAPGDRVFGTRTGSYAEYLDVRADGAIAAMPASLGFAEAAAVPVAAITALQALRDVGRLQPGQRVLVNGASGGVGSFAVQIAKRLGAEVTAVCSTRNVEWVRALGADHVIDYTREDFTRGAGRWDLVVDNVGNHELGALLRVLPPTGRYVMVGGPSEERWLGPINRVLAMQLRQPFVSPRLEFFVADVRQGDLRTLADWLADGGLRVVIDRRYPLAEVPEAIAYVERGRARGKVVIEVAAPGAAK